MGVTILQFLQNLVKNAKTFYIYCHSEGTAMIHSNGRNRSMSLQKGENKKVLPNKRVLLEDNTVSYKITRITVNVCIEVYVFQKSIYSSDGYFAIPAKKLLAYETNSVVFIGNGFNYFTLERGQY